MLKQTEGKKRKNRVGRPALEEDQRKDVRINLRFTAEEAKEISVRAKESGKTPSGFGREAVLGVPPAAVRPQVNRDTYLELGRIGVNLNQLLRTKQGDEASIIAAVADQVKQLRKELLQ